MLYCHSRYTQEQVKAKYPYINCEDVTLAADCEEDEGWFDPWLLLSAYKNKIRDLGVEIRRASVSAFSPDNVIQVVLSIPTMLFRASGSAFYPGNAI